MKSKIITSVRLSGSGHEYQQRYLRMSKRIILFCCVLLIVACKSKKAAVENNITLVKPNEVEVAKKKRADDLGTRLLETCNISRFKGFNATEATDKVRQNATKEKISAICQKINQRNGRFLGINLIDITRNKITDEYTFRYNINYEKKLYKRELFVTINTDNKVSAISTKEVTPKPL
ncbi:hypothetical protein L1S35_04280 [Flavobacterium sp. AS60]|uniref:hypothetical protein n=1 Tax=Flavobacterium anseongense TaxID=2910677 RepID=UPI001F32B7AF|nr:hypothetical protein [Flavobacterium sp. AS60]MCF6128877.1 hypothetical protein [Flavobacterium sp. AS60]